MTIYNAYIFRIEMYLIPRTSGVPTTSCMWTPSSKAMIPTCCPAGKPSIALLLAGRPGWLVIRAQPAYRLIGAYIQTLLQTSRWGHIVAIPRVDSKPTNKNSFDFLRSPVLLAVPDQNLHATDHFHRSHLLDSTVEPFTPRKDRRNEMEDRTQQQGRPNRPQDDSSSDAENESELTPFPYGKRCPRCDREYGGLQGSCEECGTPVCVGGCATVHRQGCKAPGVCAACGVQPEDPSSLIPCKACEKVWYCSARCEREHWRHAMHESGCEGIKALLRRHAAVGTDKGPRRKRKGRGL